MNLPDYHTHTSRCGHAEGSPLQYVLAAQNRGLAALGVCDHLPLLDDEDRQIAMGISELDEYVREVQALKARFPGYVLLGIEADYRPETIADVAELVRSYPFDYVTGSVHYLGDWGFDQARFLSGFAEREIDEIYRDYFELVGDSAETGLFTILAHIDLVKKFGHRPDGALDTERRRLARRLAASGVVVELNTAGLRKPVAEIYPSLSLLRELKANGVGITFGSDAHDPAEVGRDFEAAADLARSAGYARYAWLDPVGPDADPSQNRRALVSYRSFGAPV
jgi:histidinol-phosphatase (PHP family)